MQRHPQVGAVDGLAALAGHPVEVAAEPDEGRDVRDGVADAVPVTVALEVHRLVEVHRAGRVQRDERQRGLVAVREVGGLGRRTNGLGEGVCGVVQGQVELGAHRREPFAQLGEDAGRDVGAGGGEADAGVGHGAKPNLS